MNELNIPDEQRYQFRACSESSVLSEKKQPLIFPGFNGLPIRGLADVTAVGPEELAAKLKMVNDVHIRLFDISVDDDKAKYETLMTAAASRQHVRVIKEVIPEGFGSQHWKIAVKWYEKYWEPSRTTGMLWSDGEPLG